MPAMSTPPSPPGSPASGQVALVPTTIEANKVQAHREQPRRFQGGRIGRPTTLTPGLSKKRVELVAELGAIEPAARVCGVPPQTVRGWLARGENRHSQGRPSTPEYVAFVADIEKALGQWECERLAGIVAAGKQPRHWTANAWLLERRWPGRYGRRTALDVSGTLTLVQLNALLVGLLW